MRIGSRLELSRWMFWGAIMVAALIAFELFNFSTTEYALGTFFGSHYDALGLASWATVLAVAFCGIDFAGLSRLFMPEQDWRKEPKEVWLLTAAWLMGATMNAAMTWWAVLSALEENAFLGNELVRRDQIINLVPVFVAVLVWLTRVSLIGTIASAGDRLFAAHGSARPRTAASYQSKPAAATTPAPRTALPQQSTSWASRGVPASATPERNYPYTPPDARRDPRGGMPIGAKAQPAPASGSELTYVDVD